MPHVERGRELTQELRSGRFEAQNLMAEAILAGGTGDTARAQERSRAALEVSRQSGIAFTGPRILGFLALVTDDPEERRAALRESEEILRQGAVSHNHLFFYRFAMQTTLEKSEWEEAERYAALLESYTAEQPLPWSDFFIACARALAMLGRDGPSAAVESRLRELRDQAESWGLASALPALDGALGNLDVTLEGSS